MKDEANRPGAGSNGSGPTRHQIEAIYALVLVNDAFRKKFVETPSAATLEYLGFELDKKHSDAILEQRGAILDRGKKAHDALEPVRSQKGLIPWLGSGDYGGSAGDN